MPALQRLIAGDLSYLIIWFGPKLLVDSLSALHPEDILLWLTGHRVYDIDHELMVCHTRLVELDRI